MEININDNQTITELNATVISVERNNNNGKRASIIITNTGNNPVTIAIGSHAEVYKGIVLFTGGVWSDSRDGAYWPTQQHITAIAIGAETSIAIQERVVTL